MSVTTVRKSKGRTKVVILKAHPAVTHQVGIPVGDGSDELFERARRTYVGCERWPERVHGTLCCQELADNGAIRKRCLSVFVLASD